MATFDCVLFVLSVLVLNVFSFNLDTFNYVRQSGQNFSMFGFSVATHSTAGQTWTIVGAPEADSRQPEVMKGGSVFRCNVDRDDTCQELPFDRNGNQRDSKNRQIDKKSHQWFGATVHSGGPDKPIVACAPRYVWFSTKLDRRDPVGTCYLCKGDFTDFHEYSPCRTKNWGYHRQGTCQAGLGAAVSKDGESLFIGAPGSWYWQGQIYSLDPNVYHPYTERFGEYGDSVKGQVHAQSVSTRPAVLSTKESSAAEDDSYLGYSIAAGDFLGDGRGGVAVGMPRGNSDNGQKKLVGKVAIYTWNLSNAVNITGEQLGAYFGYSVAAADVDGDGLTDLITGAPMFADYSNKEDRDKYEVGRVYVHYQRSKGSRERFSKYHTRDGTFSKGRFGLAVASLGDLDLDGYEDIAIGAPYAGTFERGIVYIYYGSSQGLLEKASQIIVAESISPIPTTFGFSLSGSGVDLDGNAYPDMVVGAYLSDQALVFKSRPVIKAKASVVLGASNKVISLDDKTCTLRDGKAVSCTDLKVCFHYNGTGVPRDIDLNVEFVLDSKKPKDPRMFFLSHERNNTINQTWRLEYQTMNCNNLRVFLTENLRDKLTPLEVELRYSLREEERHLFRRSTTTVQGALLDRNSPQVYRDSIKIRKNCGADDVCIPDLKLLAQSNVEKYLLGSTERLEIDVKVQNHGEDSFESVFYMKVPQGIDYSMAARQDTGTAASVSVQCSPPTRHNNHTLKCDIGNPLPAGKLVHFKVILDPKQEEGMAPTYNFEMWVNSTNPEEKMTTRDNFKNVSINIWVQTNIYLSGWPKKSEVHYNSSDYKSENYTTDSEIGPEIVHWYNLKNNGSLINQASILIIWPDQTLAGDDLLYLLQRPETDGAIRCEKAFPNPLRVTVDRRYYLKDYLRGNKSSSEGSRESEEEAIKLEQSEKHALSQGEHYGQTGGGHKTQHSWSSSSAWNSSQVGGGPVVTHSWNKTHYTDKDGIVRKTQHSSSGQGATGGGGYRIIHTSSSSGGQHKSDAQSGAENGFRISGQTTGQTSQEQHSSQGGKHFVWNGRETQTQRVQTTHREGSSSGTQTYTGQTDQRGHYDQGGRGQYDQTGSRGHYDQSSTQYGSSGSRYDTSSTHRGTGTQYQGARDYENELTSHTEHRTHPKEHGTSEEEQEGARTEYKGSAFDWDTYRRGSAGGTQQGATDTRYGTSGSTTHTETQYGSSGSGTYSGTHQGATGQSGTQYGATDSRYGTSGTQYGATDSRYGAAGTQYEQTGGQRGHSETHYGSSGSATYSGTHQGAATHSGGHQGAVAHSGGHQGAVAHSGGHQGVVTHSGGHQGVVSHSGGHQGAVAHSGGHQGSMETQYGANRDYSGQFASSGGAGRDHDASRDGTRRYGSQGSHHNGTHQINWSVEGSRTVETQRGTAGGQASHSGGQAGGSNAVWHNSNFVTEESINQGIDDYTQGVLTHNQHRNRTQTADVNYGAHGLAGAAVDGGFRTTALDLGHLGTGTGTGTGTAAVDSKEKHYDDEYYDEYSNEKEYDPDLGSYEERPGGRSGVSYGASRTYMGDRQGSGESRRGSSSEAHYSHSSHHSSSSGGTGGAASYTRQHSSQSHRQHRQTRQADTLSDPLEDHKCTATHCSALRCTIGPLKKDEQVWVVLRFRLNAGTVEKLGLVGPINLSTMMRARVDRVPYIGEPAGEERVVYAHEVETSVVPLPDVPHEVEPLWIIVLSAVAGALILLLLAFLLYKCGFFKRNRPSDAPERVPLNRNGGYHGDEQL